MNEHLTRIDIDQLIVHGPQRAARSRYAEMVQAAIEQHIATAGAHGLTESTVLEATLGQSGQVDQ